MNELLQNMRKTGFFLLFCSQHPKKKNSWCILPNMNRTSLEPSHISHIAQHISSLHKYPVHDVHIFSTMQSLARRGNIEMISSIPFGFLQLKPLLYKSTRAISDSAHVEKLLRRERAKGKQLSSGRVVSVESDSLVLYRL
jgi:hypothetical protein